MLTSLLLPLLLACQSSPISTAQTDTAAKTVAPDAVHISTEQWQGFTHTDYSGAYFDLFRLLYQPYSIRLEVTFTNYNRALTLVRQHKADMTLAVSGHNGQGLLLSAQPIDQDRIVAIFHPQWQQLNSVEDLKPLRLAWNLAYDFGAILGLSSTGYEVMSVQNGVELVLKQRIDVYLAEQSQIAHYVDSGQLQLTPLVVMPVAADNIYAAFADTPAGRQLKCLWDQRFATLLASGELRQFYQRYGEFYLVTD